MRALAIGIFALAMAGCSSPEVRWAGDPQSLVPELCGDSPDDASKLDAQVRELRDRGRAALREGDFHRATQLFDDALDLAPSNVGLVALHAVASDGVNVSVKESAELFDKQRPVKLEPPEIPEGVANPKPLRMRMLGEVTVETKEDFRELGSISTSGLVPQTLRRVYRLKQAVAQPQGGVIVYERNQRHYVVQVAPGSQVRVADYSGFVDKDSTKVTRVWSSTFSGDTIYTSLESPEGAGIVAHNRKTGKPLWRTARSDNYNSLLAVGDHLLAVAGRDNSRSSELVVLDRATGRQVAQHPLSQWNPQLHYKDGLVFALSGSRALVFEVGASNKRVAMHRGTTLTSFMTLMRGGDKRDENKHQPNVFAIPPDEAVAIADEHRCGVDSALAELDAGRWGAASVRLSNMERIYPAHPLVVALGATSRYMLRQADGAIDLGGVQAKSLRILPSPEDGTARPTYTSSMVKLRSDPAEALQRWAQRHDVRRYTLQPDDLPETVPLQYGRHQLSEWVKDESGGHVMVYGLRYIVLVRDGKVEAAFDARTLFDPNDDGPSHRGVVHLAERYGNNLLVSFTDLMGRAGVAAIDMRSAGVAWRSSSSIYANNFVVARDHVIVASGSELIALSLTDGAIVGRVSVGETPRGLASVRERVLVNVSSGSHEYAITRTGG